jgi:hypothetical protein
MPYGTVNADVIGTSVANTSLGAGNASIMKNRIINGAMVIDQRNAGASVTPTDGAYTLDRWATIATAASKFSIQQNAGAVSTLATGGFSNYLGITSLSAYSVAVGDILGIQQRIEGFNTADLQWGTANAKAITLSAWVYSSLTGTFGGSLINSAQNYSYPFTYTISTANTWTQISVTIAGPTAGTWIGATNGIGIQVNFGIGGGTTYSGTAGAWASQQKYTATGATSVVGTNGATFYITGVQLEVGSSATGYEYENYTSLLTKCLRYYYRIKNDGPNFTSFGVGVINNSTTVDRAYTALVTPMRVYPTVGYSGLRIYDGTTAANITSLISNFSNSFVGSYSFGASGGGLTTGRAGMIIEQNSSAGYLDFSAEL